MTQQILHIDLDGFFVAVERARRPELRGQPVVIGGRPEGVGRVAAASTEARATGVCVGLPLHEAARRCPAAYFLAGDLEEYGDVADAAEAILRRAFTRVECVSLDEAYVDTSSLRSGVGSLVAATEAIQAGLRDELQVAAACGVGMSTVRVVDAAHAAHSGTISLTTAASSGTALAGAAVTALHRALTWSRSVTRLSVRASSLCSGDLQPSLFASTDRRSRSRSCERTARGVRDLERILLTAGDRTLTRRAS